MLQLIWPVLGLLLGLPAKPTGQIEVQLEGLRHQRGDVKIAIFDQPAGFEAEKPLAYRIVPADNGKSASFQLPYGRYVVAVYHDENGNGRLDRNVWGVPTEAYAFSRPPASKWRAPEFEELAVALDRESLRLRLVLEKW